MIEPYTFDPEFEAALVAYIVTDRKAYGSLRSGLDPVSLPTKEAQVIAEMCALVFTMTGNAPGSSVVVAQMLRCQHAEEGKLTYDGMVNALQYMEDAIDADNRPPVEMVVNLASAQFRERMQGDVLRDALMGLDPAEMRRRLEVAEGVGFIDTSLGSKLGIGSFADIARLSLMDKIPTGVPALDQFLEGGAPRGQLWVWLGDSNAGKSTALGQQAAAALREGALVLYATNELPEPMVKAKIFSDLTGVPFTAILAGTGSKRASEVYVERAPHLGDLYVKEIETGITTPADLDDWRKEVEQAEGRPVDLMCIDYADRMSDGLASNASDYIVMRNVYNGLVAIAKTCKMVVATASQAKDKARGQKYTLLGDMADSRHKGRIANVVISLNWDSEEEEMTLYVCKQKLGRANVPVGPFPADWEYGRISQIPDRVLHGARPSDDWKAQEVHDGLASVPNPFVTA